MAASYLNLYLTRPNSRGFGTSTARTGAQDFRALLNEIDAAVSGAHSLTSVVARESLISSGGTITLASCAARTVIKINGVPFTAVSTTPVVANNEFDASGSDTADATSLAAAINNSTSTAISGVVTATAALGVVTLVGSATLGYAGNGVTITTEGVVGYGTITPATAVATNTFTINGVVFTARKEMARGTVTCASVQAGDTVTVNGFVFTAVNGSAGAAQFDMSQDDATTGAQLASAIGAQPTLAGYLGASDDGAGVVSLRYSTSGTAGNAVTLATSNNTRLAKSGTTLSGGQATSASTFDYGDSNAQAAAEVVRAVNASTDALVSAQVRAIQNASVASLYSILTGLAGNRITLASSGSTLAVSGARLTGGTVASREGAQATGTVTLSSGSGTITATINGVAIAITWASSDTNSAALLAAAINSSTDALVRGSVTATSSAGVVTITAVRGGVEGNNVTLAASGTGATASVSRLATGAVPTTVVVSGARLTGGSTGSPVTYTL